jgi:hypothetical protein
LNSGRIKKPMPLKVDKRPLEIMLNTFKINIGNVVIDKKAVKKFKIVNYGSRPT